MAKTFHLPDLGEGLTEASIVSWHVAVGDTVAVDQPIVEVESAKAVVELPCPYAGTVVELHCGPGDVIHLDGPLITVDTGDGSSEAAPSAAPAAAPAPGAEFAAEQAPTPDDSATHAGSGAVLVGYGTSEDTTRLKRPEGGRFGGRRGKHAGGAEPASAQAQQAQAQRAPAQQAPASLVDESRNSPVVSPIVRRLARDAGFDASHLQGGEDGIVRREHVERAIAQLGGQSAQAAPAAAPAAQAASAQASAPTPVQASAPAGPADEITEIPLTGLRAVVAERLSRSRREIPEATIWLEVDVTETMALRASLKEQTGERFSMASIVGRFALAGLRRHPVLNSTMTEDGRTILQHSTVNLGLAAQTERGLVVPVIHGASAMSLRGLRDAIDEIAQTPGGVFPPAKLQGATFTLNNYGGFGVDGSAPILNQPEVAMLGIGRVIDKPWVADGELAIRKIATLTFVFDHRVCDGDTASGFLTFVAGCLESPTRALADL